jgi:pimeloyl-ACP methyl ester carboxylesterase
VPELWDVLLAGDLNPALRAELPGALRAMLRRDRAPILRLLARAAGLTGTAGEEQAALQSGEAGAVGHAATLGRGGLQSGGVSEALFAATRCEETDFPWTRSAGASTRLRQARAAARRLPTAPFAPFGRSVALSAGLFDLCAHWPAVGALPAPAGPLPNVPTLVLNGSADLRTSAEQARAAVAGIPGARVAIVARSGHSVLGSDLGNCAERELEAFANGTAPSCSAAENVFQPTPRPPASLRAVAGRTKVARTVNAVVATLDDVRRQLIGDAIAAQRPVSTGSRTAGLRGGAAIVQDATAVLSRVAYVPGVEVSGTYAFRGQGTTQVRVGGPQAARGQLTIDADDRITGSLGGTAVSIAPGARAAAAPRERWPEPRFPYPALR